MENTNTEPGWMQLVREVSDNPAAIRWPADRWGYTAAIRKAVTDAAGRTGGNTDKEDLLIGTLMVALAHVKARREKDAVQRRLRFNRARAGEEARAPMERFGTFNNKKEQANG
jgi:hypothetical protein